MIKKYKGDLLESDCNFIVHQTNCLSSGGVGGFAFNLYSKYKEHNVYELIPTNKRHLGMVDVRHVDTDNLYIVSLFAQYFPGGYIFNSDNDKQSDIALYFKIGLDNFKTFLINEFRHNNGTFKIGFPFKIGCNIAGGGDWNVYDKNISEFAESLPSNFEVVYYEI
jgi:O-acetyl-ADP-ribose deacetylase (regulator of RNase III)